MLKVRVMPSLLWKGLGLVKGVGFNSWRRVGSILPSINIYNARDVDELVILNVTATQDQEAPDYDAVSEYSSLCRVPLTIGGGVHDLEQISALLAAGADKVSINSALGRRPELIDEAARQFGSQCVVVSIDARKLDRCNFSVFTESGSKNLARDPADLAAEVADRGAGEILLTSIDREGTMTGFDLELIERVTSRVKIPVIASGGAGEYQHFVDAVQHAGASAVSAASIFHFTQHTPRSVKMAMHSAGIPVRLGSVEKL